MRIIEMRLIELRDSTVRMNTGEPRYTMVRYTMIHLYDGYVLLPFVSMLRCCRAFTMLEITVPRPLGGQFPIKIHFPRAGSPSS